VEIDPLQVNRLHERFEDWRSRGRAREDLDREDIEYLAQYVLSEPAEPKTWDWLMRWADSGHIVGYGVLRHETKEIQYLLDHGINPLDPVRVEETRPIWDRGHALGLTAEAILHVRTAFSKGVEFSLGDAILANPAGDGYVDLSYVEEYTNKKERQKFSLATTDQGRIWAYQYFGVGDEE